MAYPLNRTLCLLLCAHISVIALSNMLVQIPVNLWGWHSTWGAFTYPLIFIFTDLTVRLMGQRLARQTVYWALLPGLLISYGLTGNLRVALASFAAYFIGQLLDIFVFQHFRKNNRWWLAPALSTSLGNLIDTFLFFAIAFAYSHDAFMRLNWPEIATVDFIIKSLFSLIFFVPLYGMILQLLLKKKISSYSNFAQGDEDARYAD